MDLAPAGIIVLAVVGSAVLFWTIIKRDRERSRARESRCVERGWTYTRGGGPGRQYSVQGTEGGSPWTLALFPGGKNKTARTSWSTPDPPLVGGAVFVGSKAAAALFINPLGKQLARWGLRVGRVEGDVSAAWAKLMDGHQKVDSGDPEFDASYSVLATDPGQARRLVTAEACRAILAWDGAHKVGRLSRGSMALLWSDAGLRVSWEGSAVETPDDMVGFVELGFKLTGPFRSGW